MSKLNLKIITPEKEVFSGEVEQLTVTTPDGEVGILPNHASLITQVSPGEVRILQHGKTIIMASGGGLLQVADNSISLLTDLARDVKEIDEKVVEEAKDRAEEALEKTLSDEEYAETFAVLERSLAQLKVKRRHRSL